MVPTVARTTNLTKDIITLDATTKLPAIAENITHAILREANVSTTWTGWWSTGIAILALAWSVASTIWKSRNDRKTKEDSEKRFNELQNDNNAIRTAVEEQLRTLRENLDRNKASIEESLRLKLVAKELELGMLRDKITALKTKLMYRSRDYSDSLHPADTDVGIAR